MCRNSGSLRSCTGVGIDINTETPSPPSGGWPPCGRVLRLIELFVVVLFGNQKKLHHRLAVIEVESGDLKRELCSGVEVLEDEGSYRKPLVHLDTQLVAVDLCNRVQVLEAKARHIPSRYTSVGLTATHMSSGRSRMALTAA